MNVKGHLLLLWLLIAAGLVACHDNSSRLAGPPSSGLASRFDRVVPDLLARHPVPGVQIAVIDEGAVKWRGSYGVADKQTSRPVTDHTLFNIGSISKVAAAWGVMALLEERKEITLDSPVQPYLKRWKIPASEFDLSQVTVRRLLSHTSGLSVFPASESFTYPTS